MENTQHNFLKKCDNNTYSIADSISDLVRVIDANGVIVYANEAMKKAFGIDPVKMNIYNKKVDESVIPKPVSTSTFTYPGVIKEERRINKRYYSIQSSPVFDQEKNIQGTVEVFRDITNEYEQKQRSINTMRQLHKDISFAKTIQEKILPQKGRHGDLLIDYRYVPSVALSGDIFDCFVVDDDHVAIYIADIVGHGIAASLITMFVRQTMRSIICKDILMPNEVLQELKKRYTDLGLDDSKYFTIFYGIYSCSSGIFTCANAGHNAIPIRYNDSFKMLMRSSGFPISYAFPDNTYMEKHIPFKKGDKILFYTDGITEINNNDNEEFGEKRLLAAINTHKDHDLLEGIIDEINAFRWGEQQDDWCLLLVEVDPEKQKPNNNR